MTGNRSIEISCALLSWDSVNRFLRLATRCYKRTCLTLTVARSEGIEVRSNGN